VLDNCEQVVGACAALVEPLLRGCPNVRVLATSRETLGVSGEAFWQVPALSLPDLMSASGPVLRQAAERSEAVRLFVDRAALRQPAFTLSADNARAIAHVCRSLDGIPLAIELAAARLSVLSVDEVAARLDHRFRELVDPQGSTPRHRTLRGVVDWSYQLLARAEARLFERLSAFAGGCTLAAAEAVCAGGEVGERDVLDLMGRLVEKSFVVADMRRGETRYRLLETLRQYGEERLERDGEAVHIRDRHAAYFCALAEQAEPKLKGPEQLTWYERLEAEHDNIRAALGWALANDAERALRIAGSLWRFWDVRTYKEEGRRWLEAALAGEERASVPVRIKALNGAGNMAQATGDYARSTELHERSLALAREIGDTASAARSLTNLGDQAMNLDQHERARALQEESLRLAESMNDAWGIGASSIELGQIAYDLGALDEAERHYSRGSAAMRSVGDRHRSAHALIHLGKVARERGDLDTAARMLGEALRTVREFADAWMTSIAVGQLACIATARGDPRTGARLLAAGDAARSTLALRQAPYWGRDLERWTTVARAALDDAAFAASWEAGAALTLDEAVVEALGVAGTTPSGATAGAGARGQGDGRD
jgi:non-specific serine/threonine protein kinase